MHRYDKIVNHKNDLQKGILDNIDEIFNKYGENGRLEFPRDIIVSIPNIDEDTYTELFMDTYGLSILSENDFKLNIKALDINTLFNVYTEIEIVFEETTYSDVISLLPKQVKLSEIPIEGMIYSLGEAIEQSHRDIFYQDLYITQSENINQELLDNLLQALHNSMIDKGFSTKLGFLEIYDHIFDEIDNRDISIELFMENEIDVIVKQGYFTITVGDLIDGVFDNECVTLGDNTHKVFIHAKTKDLRVELRDLNRTGNKLEFINFNCK